MYICVDVPVAAAWSWHKNAYKLNHPVPAWTIRSIRIGLCAACAPCAAGVKLWWNILHAKCTSTFCVNEYAVVILGMLFVCVCYLILAREIWIVFHNNLSLAYVTPSSSVAIISFCLFCLVVFCFLSWLRRLFTSSPVSMLTTSQLACRWILLTGHSPCIPSLLLVVVPTTSPFHCGGHLPNTNTDLIVVRLNPKSK